MEYSYLLKLKQQHAAWRLLNADHAPFIVSFLFGAFIRPNARSIRQGELVDQLEDHLHRLRQAHGPAYPRAAQQYLDDWASGDAAYLRKYYSTLGDEPQYDLTPATEKAIDWLRTFEQRQFVGTESRLLTVFQLLRDIVQATETDPQARINELEKRRAEIDLEIARLKDGALAPHDPTQVKERFLQVEETARRLLSDFRQVEENFRRLDRETRERIAVSAGGKGELLDAIFGEQHAIADSDQGKSFRAFWGFLMSPARQDELQQMLQKVLALQEVRELAPDELLPRIKARLMEAGEQVQRTSATLVEQLRKYLDDQVWLENKRIMEMIQGIEKHAVALRQAPPSDRHFAELSELKPGIELPMSRSLFVPPDKPRFDAIDVEVGEANVSLEALFHQHHVDERALLANIRRMLAQRSQVTLAEIVEAHPLEHGLSEAVVYLHIACRDPKATIDPDRRQELAWNTPEGPRRATLPTVIFTR